jgi:HEPN domain-containing protein
MKDNRALAQGWIRKADSDLSDVRRTVESDGPYDTACFHAQQAVEKCLKGFLALHNQPIPRSHDLEELVQLCLVVESIPELQSMPLEELSGYAVEMRYDADFWPSKDTAMEALGIAEQVRHLIGSRIPISTTAEQP